MDVLHAIVLAVVQGIVEFLPISSSAHLILVPELLGWPDQGLAFDVAVHVGTLLAVVLFLRDDLRRMVPAWLLGWRGLNWNNDGQLAWMIVIATIPLGLVGLIFKDFIELKLRSAAVIAASTFVFALFLAWADRHGKSNSKTMPQLTFKHSLLVGAAQAFALIPGTSRSGVTMTSLLALGYSRTDSARFSFLLAIPAIALPGLLKTLDLATTTTAVDWAAIFVGVLVSALVAFSCMHVFMRLVERVGMLPFVIYRVLLSLVIVVVLL